MTDTDSLKRRVSLAAVVRSYGVELKKQGSKLFAHCPFHDDSTPSFSLYVKDGNERAGCKGCDWDGDVIQFVMAQEGCDFQAAVAKLEAFAGGVPIPPVNPTSKPSSKPKRETKPGKLIATYDYLDHDGSLILQVLRRETLDAKTGNPIDHKHFSQRRPDGQGGWVWNLNGVVRQLYRLQAVAAADTVWIVEGEKDVHSLEDCGLIATTNAGGAKAKWEPQYTETLRGKHVIICGDSDAPGRERDATIAVQLAGVAASVRMIRLPEGLVKDVSDWLEAGQEITALLEMAEPFTPPAAAAPPPPPPPPRVDFVLENGGDWRAHLLYNHMRNPKPSIANVEKVLRLAPEWRGALWYSEFGGRVYARRPFPGSPQFTGDLEWSDKWDTTLTCWLHEEGIMVSTDVAGKAVQSVAAEQTFHPVREYLSKLEWDGMPRLDNWLIEYCRAKAKHYTAAVGPRWMVSAVARIFDPGCQADSAIILEGEQGIKKSTALRVLGGEWFTDEISILGSKDASIDTQGIWIIEISELDAFRAAEVSRIKAFMSRRWNRFRPPYGKHAIQFPRQCVFAATTNQDNYLPDETGNRRFWPVQCTAEVDIDELAKDRDQLWAEAVWKYRDGFPVYLDDLQLVQEAQEEQARRYEADVWEDRIAEWLESKSDVSVTQILEMCISKPMKDCTQRDKVRVARCLRALKWVKYRAKEGDVRENRYRRSVMSPKQSNIAW